jgi:hypothetical protein
VSGGARAALLAGAIVLAVTPGFAQGPPADCARVLERTAISIGQRDGPGRVQVKSTTRTG